MKNCAALSFIALPLALAACSSGYPPTSPLPARGWACTATDGDGNPYHYNDPDKTIATNRALQLCRDANYVPAECSLEGCEPLPGY